MDSGDLCKWRAYFRSSGSTIFDVIDNAITVAALDNPSEFKVQREKIVMKIYRCDLPGFSTYDSQCSKVESSFSSLNVSSGEPDGEGETFSSDRDSQDVTKQFSVVSLPKEENHLIKEALMSANKDEEENEKFEEVFKIRKVLENSQNHNDEVIVELLRKLLRIDLNMRILQATMIGEAVSHLGKHGLLEIRHLVRELIRKWRVVVDESLENPTSNADNKISKSCLGDHNVVQDGPSIAKKPSLDLQQEPPLVNLFSGLAPVSPAVASSDLLNIHEKPSVTEKKQEQNPTEKTTERALQAKERNLKGKTSHLTDQRAFFGRKVTAMRALHVMESNLKAKGNIEVKNKVDAVKTCLKAKGNAEATYKPDTSQKLKRIDDAEKLTLEEASKVIKAGYQEDRKRRRAVQMLDLDGLAELKPKHQKK